MLGMWSLALPAWFDWARSDWAWSDWAWSDWIGSDWNGPAGIPTGWIGWGLAAVGLAVTIVALRGRATAYPVCRRCRHPAPAAARGIAASGGQPEDPHEATQKDPPPSTCSECGAPFRTPRDLTQRVRHPQIASFALIITILGAALGLGNGGWTTIGKAVLPRYRVGNTQTFDSMRVRILTPRWSDDFADDIVEVEIAGTLVYRTAMLHPSVGLATIPARAAADPTEHPGAQSDADTLLWIRSDTGGSGGYSTTYCFRTEPDGVFLPFVTLANGLFEGDAWRQPDVTYRYWLTSGAASPVPSLRARPTEAGLEFLPPAAAEGPSAAELAAIVRTVSDIAVDAHAQDLMLGPTLRGFLDLVYAGRAEEAWTLLADCWNAGLSRLAASGSVADFPRSREALETMLMQRMATSPYHDELLRRNNGSIARPDR